MAIKRYHQKPKTFVFDDLEIGIRRPTTSEMVSITKQRAEYIKTVKAQIIEERKEDTGIPLEGDTGILFELHKFVSGMLCCDPENASIPWFAPDAAEGARLQKDTVDDVPQAFHTAAFEAFVGLDQQIAKEAAGPAAEGENKVIPLHPTTATENPTTSASVETSSPSANGSEDSTPINTLEPGTTATS